MNVYYNEHDRFAAAWLRELIRDGLIPAGDVDERDIQLVQPADLAGYVACHFFAGIGGWAYALQLAGWPADRPVWTGSCPCQPFSAAGKGAGFNDSRHLWPSWFRLIRECRPPVVFGEQVASADGFAWFDNVSTDLEAEAYAVGAADLPAASVGAPHLRQRLFFVANGTRRGCGVGGDEAQPRHGGHADGGAGLDGVALGDTSISGRQELRRDGNEQPQHAAGRCAASVGVALGDPDIAGLPQRERISRVHRRTLGACAGQAPQRGGDVGVGLADTNRSGQRPSGGGVRDERDDSGRGCPVDWADLIWLPCTDGKARPTQSGLLPLVDGVRNRVGTLRGAGNAIVPQVGAAFVGAFLEAEGLNEHPN